MKNTAQSLLVLCLASTFLSAQKEDRVWVVGHDYNFADSSFGRIQIDFNETPPAIDYFVGSVNMNMFICNASIADTSGSLLFYSNGCDIANENGNILLNGSDINPGEYHNALCDQLERGYSAGHPGIMILPLPGNDSLYYLFHMSVKYIPPPMEDGYVDRLLCSIVKVKNNKKTVQVKNVPVIIDSLATGEMNAVKHANGKDWWIILPRRNSNQFYTLLFTENGVVDTFVQTIGFKPLSVNEGYGQTVFSPHGDKMFRFYPHQPVGQYYFDRQNGKFTSYDTIHVEYGNEIAFDGGCAVSPSGRYLYVMALTKAYQFDLLTPNISATQTTIATWDGFADPIAISFWHCQLGPDCKIYVVGGGDTRYYHIIHNPDEQGLACDFEQRGMVFPVPSGASIPYFPNYRLGPLDNPGLPCSAVVSTNTPPRISVESIRVFPNPATDQVTFVWEPESAPKELTLRNAYGQIVQQTVTTSVNQTYTWSIERLASGMYFWELTTITGVRLGLGKLMKQ